MTASAKCARCQLRQVYGGRYICADCRASGGAPAPLEVVNGMLAEYQARRDSLSVVDDANVYFVVNAYVDVLLTVRAAVGGGSDGARPKESQLQSTAKPRRDKLRL